MPNAMAHLAVLSSPLIIFLMFRLFSVPTAIVAGVLGGYLLLPTKPVFDFPLVPALDKDSLPALTVLLLCMIAVAGARSASRSPLAEPPDFDALPGWLPRSRLLLLMLTLLVVGAIGTAMTNADALAVGGPVVLPGLRPYDAMNLLLTSMIALLPFLVARRLLSDQRGMRTLLIGLAAAGIGYSFLALVEIRLSPQLNTWVFGYFQHSFAQHMRGGGFRPVVFLPHGLWLGIFLCMAALACFGLRKIVEGSSGAFLWLAGGLYLLGVIFLSKAVGAFIILVAFTPVALFFSDRLKLLVAGAIVAIVLTHPITRALDLLPTQQVVTLAEKISPDRAGSLAFRLANDEVLLDKAGQKPLFGWGGWGRNIIYSPETGARLSTFDGHWIITISSLGWTGYLGLYGLLGVPILLLAFRKSGLDGEGGVAPEAAALSLLLAANLIDMLVNDTATPITWLLAGALAGVLERKGVPSESAARTGPGRAVPRRGTKGPLPVAAMEDASAPAMASRYTRQTKVHRRGAPPATLDTRPKRRG